MGEHWVSIGHSHVGALARAQAADLDCINFWDHIPPWAPDETPRRLNDELTGRVARGRLVISMIGGQAHTVLGMVEHPRAFDFILPSSPDLPVDETRTIVPADAVRAKIEELALPLLDSVIFIEAAATAPVVHVPPPPPLADSGRIASQMGFMWGNFPGQPWVIAPKWVRYKVWRMLCEVTEACCLRHGIRFLPSPAAATDDDGFLRPEFDLDGAHANGAYGALVLQALGR